MVYLSFRVVCGLFLQKLEVYDRKLGSIFTINSILNVKAYIREFPILREAESRNAKCDEGEGS